LDDLTAAMRRRRSLSKRTCRQRGYGGASFDVVHRPIGGSVDRTKARLFLIAFIVIGILTIIEGINDGWTALNWIVLAVSIVFGAQSALVLMRSGSPPS
jgi:hypothetical protein